jgi:hypothetical protein
MNRLIPYYIFFCENSIVSDVYPPKIKVFKVLKKSPYTICSRHFFSNLPIYQAANVYRGNILKIWKVSRSKFHPKRETLVNLILSDLVNRQYAK